jgi:hypothetical protein
VSGRAGRGVLVLAVAALAVKLSLGLTACDDPGSYIFSGEQYDPVLNCMEPVTSIDVIAGSQPGSCAPVCILSLPQDGGQIAYVSTLCGPYPDYPFETDAGSDPLCIAAMAAFNADALCEDGGVVRPPQPDAGSEAGADANALLPDAMTADATAAGDSSSPIDSSTPVESSVPADASEPVDSSAPIDSSAPLDASGPTPDAAGDATSTIVEAGSDSAVPLDASSD